MISESPVAVFVRGGFGLGLSALWGALWGSFYNVVVARLPYGESVVSPPSHCRNCRKQLRWFDNIPILAYLLLRGRCRHCGERYSPRYPLVEAVVAALSMAVHRRYLAQGSGSLALDGGRFVVVSLFAGLLVAISLIDIDTMLIPDAITYPGIPISAALSLLMGLPRWWDGAVGAVCGYLVIRLFADGYEWLTGRQGMGYGDAKLLAMICALMGWQVLLPTLFLASIQGSVIGISALVLIRHRAQRAAQGDMSANEANEEGGSAPAQAADRGDGDVDPPDDGDRSLRYAKMPFGPYLALAALELLLWRGEILRLFPYFQ